MPSRSWPARRSSMPSPTGTIVAAVLIAGAPGDPRPDRPRAVIGKSSTRTTGPSGPLPSRSCQEPIGSPPRRPTATGRHCGSVGVGAAPPPPHATSSMAAVATRPRSVGSVDARRHDARDPPSGSPASPRERDRSRNRPARGDGATPRDEHEPRARRAPRDPRTACSRWCDGGRPVGALASPSGSQRTRSASRPASTAPFDGRPNSRAGVAASTSTIRSTPIRPAPRPPSTRRDSSVSMPGPPLLISGNGGAGSRFSVSSRSGTWSLPTTSRIPSRSAAHSASTSAPVRSGGEITRFMTSASSGSS